MHPPQVDPEYTQRTEEPHTFVMKNDMILVFDCGNSSDDTAILPSKEKLHLGVIKTGDVDRLSRSLSWLRNCGIPLRVVAINLPRQLDERFQI